MAVLQSVDKLIDTLRRAPHDFEPSPRAFPEVNVETFKKDLTLEARAQQRAADNEPPLGSDTLDVMENEIIDYIEKAKRSAANALADQIHTYADRLLAIDFEGRVQIITNAARNSISDFKKEVEASLDELHSLRRSLLDIESYIIRCLMSAPLGRIEGFS